MGVRRLLAVLATLAVLAPATARAQEGLLGRWSIWSQGGTDLELSGDVISAGTASVAGLPSSVTAIPFKDAFKRGFRYQLSVGRGVTETGEVFLRGSLYRMSGQRVSAGQAGASPLSAAFGQYREWGLELGYRHHFQTRGRVQLYVAPAAGLRFLQFLLGSFEAPAELSGVYNAPIWDDSTVGVFGGDLGFGVEVLRGLTIGIEAGVRYQTKPTPGDELVGTGLEPVANAGSRWSVPLVAAVGVSF